MSSSTTQNDNFNDIFDGSSYDKSSFNSDATKILIVRANYYKEIAVELTLGAIVELAYLDNYKTTKNDEVVIMINREGNKYTLNPNYLGSNFLIHYNDIVDKLTKDQIVWDIKDLLKDLKTFHITIATTHGCLELPQIASRVKNDYDIIMFVGCVIRGETTHYETVCNETNRAIMDLSMSSKAVIVNAVLNVENYEQAKARSGFWMNEHQNKGGAAMKAAIKTYNEINKLSSSSGNDK